MIQITIVSKAARNNKQQQKLLTIEADPMSTRSWGQVKYAVTVLDHRERTTMLFEVKHPKKLEKTPWLAYSLLREYTMRRSQLAHKKYEQESINGR